MGWGAFIGALGSVGSSALSLWNTGKQHERNKEFSKYVGENAHQWEVNDLRNAGLNPILSSGGSGNAGGSSPTSFVASDLGQAINSGRSVDQQIAIGKEQEELLKKQQDTQTATAAKELASAELAREESERIKFDLKFDRDHPQIYKNKRIREGTGEYSAMADTVVNSNTGKAVLEKAKKFVSEQSKSVKEKEAFRKMLIESKKAGTKRLQDYRERRKRLYLDAVKNLPKDLQSKYRK